DPHPVVAPRRSGNRDDECVGEARGEHAPEVGGLGRVAECGHLDRVRRRGGLPRGCRQGVDGGLLRHFPEHLDPHPSRPRHDERTRRTTPCPTPHPRASLWWPRLRAQARVSVRLPNLLAMGLVVTPRSAVRAMSGHSKWSSIKHKKAHKDARRGKLFTKLIKEITVAARMGGGDINANPRLRTAVVTARQNSMPAEN